jgi:hypothetical protein
MQIIQQIVPSRFAFGTERRNQVPDRRFDGCRGCFHLHVSVRLFPLAKAVRKKKPARAPRTEIVALQTALDPGKGYRNA